MRKFILLSTGLIVCALAVIEVSPFVSSRRTTGIEVKIAQAVPCGQDSIQAEMVRVLTSGRIQAGARTIPRDALDRLLEETFRTRAQRLVYVTAEPGLSFGDVVAVIDIAAKRANYVSLVLPAVEREVRSHPAYCLDPNIKFSEVFL